MFLAWRRHQALKHIPAVGIPPGWGPLGPYLAARRFISDSPGLLIEGYEKYSPTQQTFKIATPTRWVLVATSPAIIRELGTCNEALLSQQATANERNSMSYILGPSIHGNPYHMKIILRKLTPHTGAIIPDLVEEATWVLNTHPEAKQLVDEEWRGVKLQGLITGCISAMTNRVLVGQDLARDEEFLGSLADLSMVISRAGVAIDLAPDVAIVKDILAAILVPKGRGPFKVFLDKLTPVFEKRRKEYGQDKERYDDLIQWVLDAAPEEASMYELCTRILYLNFSAIHTSTVSVMQSLYDLASRPEAQDQIRDEIQMALSEGEGWTKESIASMWKLDSSIRESQRLTPVTTATMMRLAQETYTLVDGTVLQKGQWIITPAWAANRFTTAFDNPHEFDPFRFEKMRSQPGQELKHQLALPEEGYYSFGGPGKHACPGRYYAATEIKVLVGYIISNFRFRISHDSITDPEKQKNNFLSFSCLPNFNDGLEFQRRETTCST
ncbi:cytochrome P450 [Ascobolus immersus RN42]|uniref:Cytochrome P450 n=1 Tax=Ascobolus immersus RN42 TaxID=1160509 RepID=A0A3N4HKK3_ASCIM|nr:cytochrome P450 [Ascobolus immersus RN42]